MQFILLEVDTASPFPQRRIVMVSRDSYVDLRMLLWRDVEFP
jgi:hypothetical protein